MQLILRQPAAHPDAADNDGVVIAASPDTLGREAWLWDIRMQETDGRYEAVVARNSEVIDVTDVVHRVADDLRLTRSVSELWVAIVLCGPVLHGGFRLETGDVAIWEGDDPDLICLQSGERAAEIRLIQISRRDGEAARWVP
jgi:hypothetical protein